MLNWHQALDKATRWFELQEKGGAETILDAETTVAEAVETYIAMRNARRTWEEGPFSAL